MKEFLAEAFLSFFDNLPSLYWSFAAIVSIGILGMALYQAFPVFVLTTLGFAAMAWALGSIVSGGVESGIRNSRD